MSLTKETKDHLYSQLIKLGDMMGDGLHHEPDGKWISKEYKKVLKALGIGPIRKNRSKQINEKMAKRIKEVPCAKCEGKLKQTRSGSMRGQCVECGALYQLLTRKENLYQEKK